MTVSSLSILIISVYFSLRFYHPGYGKAKKIIQGIVWGYCLLILASLSFIIMAYFKAPKLKIFRLHYLFLAISYSILTFVYI